MGEAFKEGWNNIAMNHAEDGGPLSKYTMMNIALFGDPAFKLHIPRPSGTIVPAQAVKQGESIVTVSGPEEWTKYKAIDLIKDEWKWTGGLYYYGAPGATPQVAWGGRYDKSWQYHYARVTTSKDAKGLKALTTAPAGTGWSSGAGGRGLPGSKLHIDKHEDGSSTLMWRVKLLDYNWETGGIVEKLVSQKFEIEY